jgi:hypothetical protein
MTTEQPTMPSNKALRKRRRRLENEAYAQDARFWNGKIKSADRMGYKHPADKKALGELKESWPGRRKRRKRIVAIT